MSRPPSTARAVISTRRRPAICTSLVLALLLIGWAAEDGSRATAQGNGRAATQPLRLSGIPRQFPAVLPSPVVPADALTPPPSPAAATGARRPAVPSASLSSTSATAAPEDALHEIPILLDKNSSATLSVAALDLTDGRRAGYGPKTGTFDTASIVKVDILAALLLQCQDQERGLTGPEKTHTGAMIRASDNDATDALWGSIGGAAGLDRANRRLGLKGTTAGTGGLWGLTQTTASDQLILLSAVYGNTSPLDAGSRAYARSLMAGIEKGQRWGVSAGGTASGLKNGWLPRSATGLWDINSIGLISAGGHKVLLATLSSGNSDMPAGVSLVERGSRAAVSALGLHGS
jgi:hypothetical protein